jgi:hypothetical protein
MLYGAGQTPVPVGSNGVAVISRDADTVFAADALASFVGKPVTIGHPAEAVNPSNARDLSHGHILFARQGAPPLSDFMVGDVLVTSKDAIDLADAGCEISCGYDAAYEVTGPGRGRQTRIVGNHLAFLPDGKHGRCGPMCYVGDQSMELEDPTPMTTKNSLFGGGAALLKKVFAAKDDAELARVLDEATADEARQADAARIAELEATVARLTKDSEKEDKGKDDDKDDEDEKAKKAKTDDAAYVAATLPRVKSAAEILAPGITFPTHDAADLTATRDAMCACQRSALVKALERPEGKVAVEAMFGAGVDVTKLTGPTLDAGFFGASAMIGALNNHTLSAMAMSRGEGGELASATQRAIDADKRSQERWNKNRAAA